MKKFILILITCKLYAADLKQFSSQLREIQAGLEGNTLLHVAAFHKDHLAASDELKKEAIKKIITRNEDGSTALDFAILKRDSEMITILCNAIKRDYKSIRQNRQLRGAFLIAKDDAKKLAVRMRDQITRETLIRQLEMAESTSCCI